MKFLASAAAASCLLALAPSALAERRQAVTDGDLDGDGHPIVGLMVALDETGNPLFRCSGTLLSPRVYLTAGHCTYGADRVTIWFDADVESGIPDNGYPFEGQVSGTPYTHPDYDDDLFYLADVGVVVLDEDDAVEGAEYASLPEIDELDDMKTRRGNQDTSFTAVGYGLQEVNPVFVEAERVRMVATPSLVQINTPGLTGDFSLLLSNNHATGGTCFGDSGGPNFVSDSLVVGGVTSFGMNGNCAGSGGVYRMDRAVANDWVQTFLDTTN